MSDIVERLRKLADRERPYGSLPDTLDEAANEIERFKASLADVVTQTQEQADEIERLRAALEWAAGKLGAHGFPDLAHQARSRAALGEEKKG